MASLAVLIHAEDRPPRATVLLHFCVVWRSAWSSSDCDRVTVSPPCQPPKHTTATRGADAVGLTDVRCAPPACSSPCHPSDRRQPEPGKITRKGGRRPSRVTRSALARDLPRLHTGA